MNGSNRHVLQTLSGWLEEGLSPWLATVIKTYGSSPRPAGSLMVYHPEKGITGSLSGGCIEQELMERLKSSPDTATTTTPAVIRFGEDPEEQQRLALPCGGHLDILLERIDTTQAAHFHELIRSLSDRVTVTRHISLSDGQLSIVKEAPEQTVCCEATQVIHRMRPHDRLLLVGAGEVARCLADIAKNLEFEVSLCDFRDEFLQGWEHEGVDVIRTMPDDLISHSFNDAHCAIVALAHDPRVDDMAMMQALKTQAFYVGAMGSERTSAARRERLTDLSVTDHELTRLHAPIGLGIHSKTPYEIAVSIAADLIRQRARTFPAT